MTKQFINAFNEAISKITKSEQLIIDAFLGKEDEELEFSLYKGTGAVRGGGAKTGKSQVNATLKLIKKGVLELVSSHNDSYTNAYVVRLLKPELISSELTDTEVRVLFDIMKWSLSSSNRFRKLTKKETTALKVLVQRKLIARFDTLDPSVVSGSITPEIKEQLMKVMGMYGETYVKIIKEF